jgi:hypothetical protein
MMSLVSATTNPRAALIHAALGASVVLAIALLPLRSSWLTGAPKGQASGWLIDAGFTLIRLCIRSGGPASAAP